MRIAILRINIFLSIFLNFLAVTATALTLDEYMELVFKKNKLVASYEISVEAANEKKIAGDLALSPHLTAGYSVTADKSEPLVIAEKRTTTSASLGVAKKFSSGTTLSLTADTSKLYYEQPVTAGNDGFSRGGLGISLQQSLWKDFFGVGTRLRQEREETTNELEIYGIELKKRIKLIEVESDFWDYIIAQEDLKLKQTNFVRAQKIDSWTLNRVNNGISDQSDLLQITALASLRELELANARDELKSREIKIKENINIAADETLPEFTASLKEPRSFISDLTQKKNIVKIESYLLLLEAELKQKSSREVEEGLRPDLSFVGRYNTSAYSLSEAEMQRNITKTDRPVTYVGLNLSWMFGSDAKLAQISAAKKEAVAAHYRAAQAKINSENAWQIHLQKYELSKKNVLILEKIAQLQQRRAQAEQIKFSKGRTITSNVVNAEEGSAQAEVNYLKAKYGLRKLEATTQLFISVIE